MIPLKLEAKTKAFPLATGLLMSCCIAMFLFGHRLFSEKGLVPLDLIYGFFHPASGLPATLVTLLLSLFMHGGIVHLASNMWYLWLFGPAIEDRLGSLRYGLLYIVAGAIASVSQAASSPLSTIPVVGASGAIAGIMGLTLLLHPRSRLVCYFPPVFFFRVPAFIFLCLWFCIQYINLSSATNRTTIVAWMAHIGGFVFGMISGVLMRGFGRKSTKRKKTG
jgi:membrane associated rhomboid family serine protease